MRFAVGGRAAFATTGGRSFNPALTAVVFVHGAGMDHSVWALQTRFFAWHGYAVLALDLPGHGRSEGPAPATIPAMADWIAEALASLNVARARAAGHSMGALVALDLAARHGALVERLALLGGALRIPVHPELLRLAAANDPGAWDLISAWGHGKRGRIGGHQAPGLWMRDTAVRLLGQAAPGVVHGDFEACDAYDGAAAAAAIRCPTLVLIAVEDRMTPPREGLALTKAITGARSHAIPGSGHMMMVEAPDATLDALKEFF
ncbi:MAG: alpha/beta hydrolase [Alphaproteobacteria bacterium]|nr:alpha/beta hydrolase [Alphaproteobacteria bacterium]